MSARSARVIDLDEYRRRREEKRREAPAPVASLPQLVWIPVWMWVPFWPIR